MPRPVALAVLLVVTFAAGTAWAQLPLPQELANQQLPAALTAVDARRDETALWLATFGCISTPGTSRR